MIDLLKAGKVFFWSLTFRKPMTRWVGPFLIWLWSLKALVKDGGDGFGATYQRIISRSLSMAGQREWYLPNGAFVREICLPLFSLQLWETPLAVLFIAVMRRGPLKVSISKICLIGWSTKDLNRGRSYRLWADILKHKEVFFSFSAFLLGDETKIRFWKDGWCEAQSLSEKFLDLFSILLSKDAFVADSWCNVSHSWNLGFWRNMLDTEFDNVATILETLHLWAPMDDHDGLYWNLNAAGNFIMKFTFLKLTKRSPAIALLLVRYV